MRIYHMLLLRLRLCVRGLLRLYLRNEYVFGYALRRLAAAIIIEHSGKTDAEHRKYDIYSPIFHLRLPSGGNLLSYLF